MYISRIFIRNFRNFECCDVHLQPGVTCLIGENNAGKTNFLYALRLAVDSNLSSTYRTLTEHDVHSGVSLAEPNQVVVSVEFKDYADKPNESALVGCWEVDDGEVARLTYRFRPRQLIRDAIASNEHPGTGLTLDDYHWEITGGGGIDPATSTWLDPIGSSIRFSELQQYLVVFLLALRDVTQDLRQSRISPLCQLIDASGIPEDEKAELVQILTEANDSISGKETIRNTGEAIQKSFNATAGDAFEMSVRLGMADPSFASIARSLTLLLSNDSIKDFEPFRNGLGLNNILYISMIIESFERRIENAKTAGQILLIEEPEAHLHPHLQHVLFDVLDQKPFQTIFSSHSTHITSHARLSSYVVFTNTGEGATCVTELPLGNGLDDREVHDLERYLDATRAALLFARKVILVEGPAEMYVIPPLVKKVRGIDLSRHGVSVIPIHGTHFGVYAKLFTALRLPKKCVIIADGDLVPSDAQEVECEDELQPEQLNLEGIDNDFIHVFKCRTTFERALTIKGLLIPLALSAEYCGAPIIARRLRATYEQLSADQARPMIIPPELADSVLAMAKRIGKARFAQILSYHLDEATSLPRYINDALQWLEL